MPGTFCILTTVIKYDTVFVMLTVFITLGIILSLVSLVTIPIAVILIITAIGSMIDDPPDKEAIMSVVLYMLMALAIMIGPPFIAVGSWVLASRWQ
jgi:hypothetical protein